MTQVNELRIGNWVQDENAIIRYVYRIWQGGAELSEDEEGFDDLDYDEDEIFGIPLTEEWLLKCRANFEKISNDNECNIQGICFEFDENLNLIYTAGEGVKLSKPINFVHQLQNLYFALTGEELTIKN